MSDADLTVRLSQQRQQLERRISREAAKTLGPAFAAEIRDVRPSESVAITVAAYALYDVAGGTRPPIDTFRQFATTLQYAIANELAELGISADVAAVLDEATFKTSTADTSPETTPWERIAPVLAAVATGIGVLGFVTLVGGAVQYARLQAAGLPAEDALTILPTANLVVVGAHTLVPALVFALAGVALLFIFRTAPRIWTALKRQRRATSAPEADQPGRVSPTVHRDRPLTRAASMAILLAGLEIFAFVATIETRTTLQVWVLVVLLGIMTVTLFACIAFRTSQFLWLGATMFVAMSMFLTGLAYARALQTSDVRGAVVIRENKKAIIGLYVAETSGRVYLGRLETKQEGNQVVVDPQKSRLVAFDKDQISEFAVGPPVDLDGALMQASALADELCDLQPPLAREKGADNETEKLDTSDNCWSRPPGELSKSP